MRRAWRRVLLIFAGLAAVSLLASGCAVFQSGAPAAGPLGTASQAVHICASGSYRCSALGNSGQNASTGFRQVLLGAQIPAGAGAPSTLTSSAPQSVVFTSSPGYAAELQRLQPAPAGRKWMGWISPSLNYNADDSVSSSQAMFITAAWQLPHAPDGSPFGSQLQGRGAPAPGTLISNWVVGVRNLTRVATADRPVSCGDSLRTFNADVPDTGDGNGPGVTFCLDSAIDVISTVVDYGVVTSGARASGPPGSLVTMPFIVRSGNVDRQPVPIPVSASTTLAGASVAVTPSPVPSPERNGDSTGIVAVGIPPGAAPGVYDVTFTAQVLQQSRVGVGKLTVLAAPSGGGGGGAGAGGGAAAKRKLTTVLPKGLTVAAARANGVPVLLGSSTAGPALVRLLQGPKKKPTLAIGKRVRLKVPGPVKVTFKSRKLVKGPYRVTISVSGKVVKTVGGRLAK